MRPEWFVFLICFVHTAYSRDFFIGMFKKNDFLVAADELYKPRAPSRYTWAQYGRVFKCKITYFRVVNRLGTNVMPRVEILRGGLLQKYIVVRLSVYNKPISVNIYVGCENKMKIQPQPRTKATEVVVTTEAAAEDDGEPASEGGDGKTDANAAADGANGAAAPEGDSTTASEAATDAPDAAPEERRKR